MLVDLQSKHLLPLNWKRTPVMMHKFNWKTIADWIIEKQLLVWDEFDGDVVDHTIEEWNELAVELCGPYDNGPHDNGPHDSKLDTHNDFKSFVDTKLTHFSSASQVSSSSEAQLCSNCVRRDGSKVQLRDTNTDVRPVVMAFESDSMSVTDQEANIKQSVWDAKVFSGNKSLHVLVQVPDEISLKLDSLDDDLKVAAWHRLYHTVAGILFKDTSKLDMACKSWLRKFRTPDGIRDNGKTQTAEFNTHKQPLHWDSLLEWAIETTKLEQANMKLKLSRRSAASKQRDVSADMRVRRYLDTPFEKTCGNGISDSLLYKSICVCTQANDDATLTEVL